ncbi:MAG: outer membrane protein assembly factor BamE [Rickettsiaceae bacterium]|jgi:outer membrane protein assembly factor BamE (lipoprotein component of BamABCDE complex)|nr:outer membrane protein assembly factor BamE [Rickettsiaceae bacterium]
MTYLHKLLPTIFLILLAGCQSIDVRGQFVSDEAIKQINSQQPTKVELIALVGTPTYVPDYSKNTWYYIQRSLAKRAWFDPKVVKQRIVKVVFNGDKVQEAGLLSDGQNEKISSQSNYTQTYGTQQNGIQKFVKNIGRFNKTTDGTKRKKKK